MRKSKDKNKKLQKVKKVGSADRGLEIVKKEEEKRRTTVKENFKKIKKKNKTAERKKIKVVIILLFIAIVIYAISNYHRLGIVFNKNVYKEDVVNITLNSSNNIIKAYQNEILVYSNGIYSTYNKYGKQTWKTKLDKIFIPEISTSGKYIQILNKDNSYVYVYNNKYESARIKIDGTIKSSTINEDGISIIEYIKAGSKTVLGIYDRNGKQMYQVKLNTSTVSQYVLSDDSKYLAYAELVIDGISLSTKINVIDLTKSNNKGYEIPNLVTINNELAYKMFFSGNKINIMFENKIIKCNCKNNTSTEFNIPNVNLLNIDIYNSKLAYIYLNSIDSKYNLDILSLGEEKGNGIVLKEAPTNIIYQDGLVYISYKKGIGIYNSFKTNVKNYSSDSIITGPVVFNNGKSIAVFESNKIVIVTI